MCRVFDPPGRVGPVYDPCVGARVLVIEPNRILRRGIRAELSQNEVQIVAEAGTGAEAIAAVGEHRPDVAVLDSRLPDGSVAEVCRALIQLDPSLAVIVLSELGDEASVGAAIEAGARAYLLKDADDLDLTGAIQHVVTGESVLDPRAAAALIDASRRTDSPKLSSQELKVLRLVSEGLTNPEIGKRLHLSRHTVKEYLSHAMRKLEVANRIEAVRKATELGLIDGVARASTGDAPRAAEGLVYNESGAPARSSDLKVTPLKIDQLRAIPGQDRK
jgi:two-component system response regulator DevR